MLPDVARIIANSRVSSHEIESVPGSLGPAAFLALGAARAWVSGIGPLPVVERRPRRGEERSGGAGQTDVSEQSERWRLIDWFVGGRIISRTRSERASALDRAHGIASVYVYPYERAIRAGRGRGRKLVM